MKLTKLYFSVVILLCTVGEVVAQTQQIIIGNVTELFGKSAEPLIGVNIRQRQPGRAQSMYIVHQDSFLFIHLYLKVINLLLVGITLNGVF